MPKIENNDKSVKAKVRKWWEAHPMDYQDWTWDGSCKDAEQLRKFFQKIDTAFRHAAFFAHKADVDTLFSRLIPYQKLINKRVLEIGCGLGAHSGEMAKNGAQVTAIDLTKKAASITKERFKLFGLSGNICVADAESLPFSSETFDFVWSWGVLHHTPDTALGIREVHRVLKRGGEARVMLYHKHSLKSLLDITNSGKKNFLKHAIMHPTEMRQYIQSLRDKYTDGRRIGGSPLAKYYSRKQAKLLFNQFQKVRTATYSQKSDLTSFFKRSHFLTSLVAQLPDCVFNMLFKRVGFFLLIKAIK